MTIDTLSLFSPILLSMGWLIILILIEKSFFESHFLSLIPTFCYFSYGQLPDDVHHLFKHGMWIYLYPQHLGRLWPAMCEYHGLTFTWSSNLRVLYLISLNFIRVLKLVVLIIRKIYIFIPTCLYFIYVFAQKLS